MTDATTERATPIYEMMPGWLTPTNGCRSFTELPPNAQRYLNRVAELTDVPICMITVGNERQQNIVMEHPVSA